MDTIRAKFGYFFEWYYILVILGYLLTLISLRFRPGFFATLLLGLVAAELLATKKITAEGFIDRLVLLYFAYNIASVLWLTKSGMPASVFTGEFVVSVLPILFYFVGRSLDVWGGKGADEDKAYAGEDRRTLGRFYEKFTIAVLIVGIAGILLYVFAPQFYIDYSFDMLFISKADVPTMRVRMNSVVGCTLLGFLGTAGMMSGAYFLGNGGKENRKTIIKSVVYIVICMVTAIMSNQRSSLVTVILVLIFINYLLFFKLDLLKKKYFYAELIVIGIVFILLCIVQMDVILKIWWRLVSLPGAVSERSEQWVAAVNNMYSTWLGNGLGANGHRALGIEDAHVIADGGLIKLYCEEGIIGFSIFLYIVINAVNKGLHHIREYYVELGLIAVTLLQSIGSNIIAFQLATPIFWFAIGRLNAGSGWSDAVISDEGTQGVAA